MDRASASGQRAFPSGGGRGAAGGERACSDAAVRPGYGRNTRWVRVALIAPGKSTGIAAWPADPRGRPAGPETSSLDSRSESARFSGWRRGPGCVWSFLMVGNVSISRALCVTEHTERQAIPKSTSFRRGRIS